MALARAAKGNAQPSMPSFARQEFVRETSRIVNTTLNRRRMKMNQKKPCLWRPNLQALSNGVLQGVLLLNIRPAVTILYAMRKSLTVVNGSTTSQVRGAWTYKIFNPKNYIADFFKTCPKIGLKGTVFQMIIIS